MKTLQKDLAAVRGENKTLTQYDPARMKKSLDASKKKLAEKQRDNESLQKALTEEILITIIVVIVMIMHLRSSLLIAGLLPLAVLMCFIGMKFFRSFLSRLLIRACTFSSSRPGTRKSKSASSN